MVKYDLQPSTSPMRTLVVETINIVETTLTLTLTPSTVQPGDTITWSGRLTRADAGSTGIQPIKLIEDVTGTVIATIDTDAAGVYSGTFAAPATDGTYDYFTRFDGAMVGTMFLTPSSSFVRGATVGIPSLQIGGPLLLGAFLFLVSAGK